MSGEVLEAYKYTISRPGAVTAVINYYRCMLNQNRQNSGTSEMIKIPILLIWVLWNPQWHSQSVHVTTISYCRVIMRLH